MNRRIRKSILMRKTNKAEYLLRLHNERWWKRLSGEYWGGGLIVMPLPSTGPMRPWIESNEPIQFITINTVKE